MPTYSTTEIEEYEYRELRRKAAAYDNKTIEIKRWIKWISVSICAVLIVIVGLVMLGKVINPKLNLYKSNTEKQSVIKEQEAKSDAAVYEALKTVTVAEAEADARVAEARGIAEANMIIDESITPSYLEYLRIQNLGVAGADVIYVPVGDDGLPITEAGRALEEPTEGE